jgi:hypothetical protein
MDRRNALARETSVVAVACLLPLAAFAGRPLSTEDADSLDDKACQVEAWIDRSRVETQAWMVPACNFGLGIEWQFGFSRSWSEGTSRFPEAYVQGKSVWGTLREGGWGVGVVGGVVRRANEPEASGWENPYAIAIFSSAVGTAGTNVHLNLGWARDAAQKQNSTLWAAAVEHPLPAGVTLLAESFGNDRDKPFFRVGGRYAAIKDRLDLDLSFVTRSGGNKSDRFISLGLHAQADRFLP